MTLKTRLALLLSLSLFTGCMVSSGSHGTWPLTEEQSRWETETGNQYNCSVHTVKGDSYNGINFSEDETVHIQIDFSDKNKVMNMSNSEIESLGMIIAQSFYPLLERKEDFKYIKVDFRNHDSLTRVSTYPKNKSAVYDLYTKKVIPNIKEPYVEPTRFAHMWQDGVGEYHRGFLSLGFDLNKLSSSYFPNLQPTGKVAFNELTDCDSYESVYPGKIKLKNGYITTRIRLIQYHENGISVAFEYSCYPINDDFSYKEVVERLCYGDYSKSELTYVNYLHPKDLNRKTITDRSIITAVSDTSSVPWKIVYTTSINNLHFYYDTDLRFR